MKNKIVLIISLILTLTILVIALLPKNEKIVNEYRIIDISKTCDQALEKIYRDNKYTYYLPCLKGDKIYLEWQNGTKTNVIDALNNNAVTIESLLDHGLEVVTSE